MASLLKKTTGLVGLAVCESPHETLSQLVLEEIAKELNLNSRLPL